MNPVATAPSVLIVEGLISPPVAYRRMRTRLLARGAARVGLAPVHVLDWVVAGALGFQRLQRRVVASIETAGRHADGLPILVIGHSGGGLLARLAMCDAPYRGQVGGAAAWVGALVSLGSPHDLHHAVGATRHEGARLAGFLAATEPGAFHAPITGYLSVASDRVRPVPATSSRSRSPWRVARRRFFETIVGPVRPEGSDGVVSVAHAHLAGARTITLPDILHGVSGGPWYGDEQAIDQWWPAAVEIWREALRARGLPAGR